MVQASEPTVYIIDDDQAVRDSLSALFQSLGIRVETFASAGEFLTLAAEPRIGCLLVDVRMPGLSGLELQEQLVKQQSYLPIIMITGHGDVTTAVRAMKAGARDFIEKPFNEQLLLERVQACLEESRFAQQALERIGALRAQVDQLTPREREVLTLTVQGKPSKVIASELGISSKTVDVHRSRLMEKLEVKSLAELIRLAIELEHSPPPQ